MQKKDSKLNEQLTQYGVICIENEDILGENLVGHQNEGLPVRESLYELYIWFMRERGIDG